MAQCLVRPAHTVTSPEGSPSPEPPSIPPPALPGQRTLTSHRHTRYDLDGNLEVIKEEPGSSLTYFKHGSHGLVTKIKPIGGTEVTFAYDALMRRTRMTEGATQTYFRHDGINLLEVAKTDGTITKLTHGHSEIDGIGSVVEVEIDGTRYYFHIDHRGTVYKITDYSAAYPHQSIAQKTTVLRHSISFFTSTYSLGWWAMPSTSQRVTAWHMQGMDPNLLTRPMSLIGEPVILAGRDVACS